MSKIPGADNLAGAFGERDVEQIRIQIGQLNSKLKTSRLDSTPIAPSSSTPSSSVYTQDSIAGDGTSISPLSLTNDEASPGNNQYYGTDSGGTKGFFSLPSSSTVSTDKSVQGDGSAGSKIQLVNDSASPGSSKYYGTDSGGSKGFFTLPSPSFTRSSANFTTGSLLNNGSTTGTVALGKSGYVLKIATDYPARVRLYVDSSSRSGDSTRPSSTPPLQGIGLITEVVTTGTDLVIELTPSRIFWNNDSPVASTIYWAATNLDSATRDITVTLNYLVLE